MKKLEDSESNVRAAALEALAASPRLTWPELVKKLEDSDFDARAAACRAVGNLFPGELVKYSSELVKNLQHSYTRVRAAARVALSGMAARFR